VAAETLGRLLNPETPGYHTPVRNAVMFDAWFLALDGPRPLVEKLGWPEMNKPGRRIEAIGAVERKLVAESTNDKAREYRTMFYSQLSEGEFVAAAVNGVPTDFSYEYVEQLGYQLVDAADPDRRERGLGYLRIAAKGREDRAPGIYQKLAQVAEKLGDRQTARSYTESIKSVGLKVTPRYLAKDQRTVYLRALLKLAAYAEADADAFKAEADKAQTNNDLPARDALDAKARPHYETAIANLHLYREGWGDALLSMYKKVAEIYAKMRDPLNACINIAAALEYDSVDKELMERRDSYYYSVPIERLQQVRENVGKWFDIAYCVTRAISILNARDVDADLLDWATHLVRLAKVMEPDSNRVRSWRPGACSARVRRRGPYDARRRARAPEGFGRGRGGVVQHDEAAGSTLPGRPGPPRTRAEGVRGLQELPQERGGHAVHDRPVLRGTRRQTAGDQVLRRGIGVRGPPALLGREGGAEAIEGRGVRPFPSRVTLQCVAR